MTTRSTPAALLLATTLLFAGCKPDAAIKKAEVIDRGPGASNISNLPTSPLPPGTDTTQLGSIHGTVSFSGPAPARVAIDMSMDPACALAPGTNLTEQLLVSHGHLGNVYVYVKSGVPDSQAAPSTAAAVLDQKGCRYIPHVLAVQQGGTVEFHNSDPTMHNIHMVPTVGNDTLDISQGPMGSPQTRQFTTAQAMIPVRCNNHPWMSAFINVAPNPFFAVTGDDGSFTINGLPPGTYTLAAIHEKLGEQDIQVTVPAKSAAKAAFTFASK